MPRPRPGPGRGVKSSPRPAPLRTLDIDEYGQVAEDIEQGTGNSSPDHGLMIPGFKKLVRRSTRLEVGNQQRWGREMESEFSNRAKGRLGEQSTGRRRNK